jgi:hypothetical protein
LFPVPYRFLSPDQRFRKYQWIEVEAAKSSDARPESYEINLDSLKIIGSVLPTDDTWRARKELIFPLQAPSLCDLQRSRKETEATLGFFKPKTITKLSIRADAADWTPEEWQRLMQFDLFRNTPKQPLEKIPFKFVYDFKCFEESCKGHSVSCYDWEMGQAYRKWRDKYQDSWQAKFRQRFESDMIEKLDTHFFVGTVRAHPNNWIIVGLFYPKKEEASLAGQGRLVGF